MKASKLCSCKFTSNKVIFSRNLQTPPFCLRLKRKCEFYIFQISDGSFALIKQMSAEPLTLSRVAAKGFIVTHMNTSKIAPHSVYSLPQEEKHFPMFFFFGCHFETVDQRVDLGKQGRRNS